MEQSYLFFIDENKKVRNLSEISYRILSLIIYSNIYFSYKIGFLTLENIKSNKLVPIKEEPYQGKYAEDSFYNAYRAELLTARNNGIKNENDIIEILNVNWNIISKTLQKKYNISNIQIFINSLFNDLMDLIISSGEMKTIQERNEFEKNVNSIVEKAINNYKDNSKIYKEVTEQIKPKNLDPKYIILESEELLSHVENEYPYYYELLSIPIVQEAQLNEILKSINESNKKYPVLYYYLNTDKKQIEYLQTFPQVNRFVNCTIENYMNNISRKDAKMRKIKDEIDAKVIPKRYFEDFLKAFNDTGLYKIADQYECQNLRDYFELRKFTENDNLSNFLIDNAVFDYGIQLAAVYQKYGAIQNSFLNNVINNYSKDNYRLEYLEKKISEKIDPQRANPFNILTFEVQQENYGSLLEMILFYSYKDSFDQNNKYDFSKKDLIQYNLDEIEEQLENLLLPGKKILSDKIDYIIYQFEGFRNQNSKLLTEFIFNYPQKTLDNEQKQILFNVRKDNNTSEATMKIIFDIQLMITFYNERSVYSDIEIKISETIQDFPPYFKIHEETIKLFQSSSFTMCQLVLVYEYFELLCFKVFKDNINQSFKLDIDNDKKNEINRYFDKNPDALLGRVQISTAVRKFISRYLVGQEVDTNIDKNHNLFDILKIKEDCWDYAQFNDANFIKYIEDLNKLNIKIGEALSLYTELGGDSFLLGETIKKQVNEEDQKEENDKKVASNKGKKKTKKNKKAVF